jgi:signal peptidase I
MTQETEPTAWRKSWAREGFETAVLALIVILFLRTFVLQAFQIPSVSMEPALLVGDRLFVDKRVFSPSAGALEDALLAKRPVRRGDVLVFKSPDDPARNFVKRAVGMPGESVAVRDGRVHVDGRQLDEPYARFAAPVPAPEHAELGLGLDPADESWGPQTVPAGHLFVLGDNRERSHDSRAWGFLRRDRVEGRALLVYWSTGVAPDGRPATFGGLRWQRLLHAVR